MNLDIKVTLHTKHRTVEVEEEVFLWGDNIKVHLTDDRERQIIQGVANRLIVAALKAGAE